MKVSRQQVVDFLHARSQDDLAQQAGQQLPDPVDTDADQGELYEYGIEVADLATLGMEESAEVTPGDDARPDDRTPDEEADATEERPTRPRASTDETAGAAVKASGEEDSA
ncbi:MAG TPA: hypothetical protein VFJ12_00195 [Segeticoccus sp.]|nr:hypothetical protein [Segeticoccus sp.]